MTPHREFPMGRFSLSKKPCRVCATWVRASGRPPFLRRKGGKRAPDSVLDLVEAGSDLQGLRSCFYLACGPLSIRRPRRAHRLGARGRGFDPPGVSKAASVRKTFIDKLSKKAKSDKISPSVCRKSPATLNVIKNVALRNSWAFSYVWCRMEQGDSKC